MWSGRLNKTNYQTKIVVETAGGITKSAGGKTSVKFLRTYIDTHGIPKSIKIDQFSGFKGKLMKNVCTKHNIEEKFCPVGDHRGCGLVE